MARLTKRYYTEVAALAFVSDVVRFAGRWMAATDAWKTLYRKHMLCAACGLFCGLVGLHLGRPSRDGFAWIGGLF
jgi:hypothetical protein